MSNWIGPRVKQLWNYAMHVLHKFLGFNINTTAFCLGRSRLHLLILKSSVVSLFELTLRFLNFKIWTSEGSKSLKIHINNWIIILKPNLTPTLQAPHKTTIVLSSIQRHSWKARAEFEKVAYNQCDQIGRFFKVLGKFFLTKVAQIFGDFLGSKKPFRLSHFHLSSFFFI